MTAIDYKKSYDSKKQSSKDRNIPFHLTLEEWVRFQKLKNTVGCFYTGRTFTMTPPKDFQIDDRPTIERINGDGAYSLNNIVWVTATANRLKNNHIELGQPTAGLSAQEVGILTRIKKTLNHKEVYDTMIAPYNEIGDTLQEENLRLAEEAKVRKMKLQEVTVAKMYAELGNLLLVQFEVDMDLTFTQYKRTLCREKCQLTNQGLPENLEERGLYIVDKTEPVTLDNILVTTKDLSNSLDTMVASSGLGLGMLKKMFNVLSK